MIKDLFGYQDKRVIVTGGGGHGMGSRAVEMLTELGAEVHVIDLKRPSIDVASYQAADLKDPDAIVDSIRNIGGPIMALFNCVGVPGNRSTDMDTILVNYLGVKHLTEQVIPYLEENASITTISSNAGAGWNLRADKYADLAQLDDWNESIAWIQAHPDMLPEGIPVPAYSFSKEAVSAWTAVSAVKVGYLQRGLRQNAIQPGFTETPLADDFCAMVGGRDFYDAMPNPLGRTLQPEDQAGALVMLGSRLAAGITGTNLLVDGGGLAALATGLGTMPAFK